VTLVKNPATRLHLNEIFAGNATDMIPARIQALDLLAKLVQRIEE